MAPTSDAQARHHAASQPRLLGWGLASAPIDPGADVGRDLVLTGPEGGPRDLALVAGVPNLVQALETALTTALGDDLFNTTFGFDGVRMLAAGVDPALTRDSIRVAVVDVLRRDPRVGRVVEVSLEADDAGHGRRTATVHCAFETVAGDSVGLALPGVVPGV